MKRAIALLLAVVMVVALCACGKDNSIELTLDNYEQYLNVYTKYYLDGKLGLFQNVCAEQEDEDGSVSWEWKDEITYTLKVEGVSQNFNYSDVSVTAKVSGSYDAFTLVDGEWIRKSGIPADLTLNVHTNIAGEGVDQQTISSTMWIHKNLVNTTIEIVAVSGKVTPVGQ